MTPADELLDRIASLAEELKLARLLPAQHALPARVMAELRAQFPQWRVRRPQHGGQAGGDLSSAA